MRKQRLTPLHALKNIAHKPAANVEKPFLDRFFPQKRYNRWKRPHAIILPDSDLYPCGPAAAIIPRRRESRRTAVSTLTA
jgi:hypothetical protein